MLKNHWVSAWRNIKRYKLYSALNVAALAVGIAVSLFAILMIRFEKSYDRHHPSAPRIFRVAGTDFSGTPFPFSLGLGTRFPEVEDVVVLRKIVKADGRVLVRAGENPLREDKLFAAGPSFFRFFPVVRAAGRPETALANPRGAILAESAARRYFGTTDCVGRVITVEERHELQIEAVVGDLPKNSHFAFNILVPVEAGVAIVGHDDRERWTSWNYKTYVLVADGGSPSGLEKKLPLVFSEEFRAAQAGRLLDPSNLRLQPLTDIHLKSHLRNELEPNRDVRSLWMFSAVVLLILLSSVLNFVGLATAQSLRRCREIGLRKVLGAARGQVVRQFLGEALLLSAGASLGALVLFVGIFPLLKEFSGTALCLSDLSWPSIVAALSILGGLVGVAASAFPSLRASSFEPTRALKFGKTSTRGKPRGRHLLLFVQFAISLGFLTTALITRAQIRHLETRDLGINADRVVVIRLPPSLKDRAEMLKREVLRGPGIVAASAVDFAPGENFNYQDFRWEGMPPGEEAQLRWFAADPDFLGTYGLAVVEGRGFRPEDTTLGERRLLVNESAVRRFGWDTAVGKTMEFSSPFGKTCRVVGVVRDFNFRSLHFPREPLVIVASPPNLPYTTRATLAVKLSARDIPGSLRFIREFCRTHIAGEEGVWSFFDDEFKTVYEGEIRLGRMMNAFSLLAVLLSGFGVFGLTAFLVERRKKEFSLRKVLGAGPARIMALCSAAYVRLLVVALVVGTPPVVLLTRNWLDRFAYRIPLGPGPFALGFVLTGGVLLGIVGWHVLRTASTNPVDNLRQH